MKSFVFVIYILSIMDLYSEDPKNILSKFIDTNKSHYSISYSSTVKSKGLFSDDTTISYAKVKVVKDTQDTKFKGYLLIDAEKYKIIYDLDKVYFIDTVKGIIEQYHPDSSYFLDNEHANYYFQSTDKSFISDTNNHFTINETEGHYHILSNYVNNSQNDTSLLDSHIKLSQKEYWIDKNSFKINKRSWLIQYDDEYQFTELEANDVEFDKTDKNDILSSLAEYKNKYKIKYAYEDYAKDKKDDSLQLGDDILDIKGKSFRSKDSVFLYDYKKNYILLVFSYMSCLPCNFSVPYINNLYDKYQNKIDIITINPYDGSQERLDRYSRYTKSKGIKNEILFVDKNEVYKKFKVKGYPTFYVIDKDMKLIKKMIGFSVQEMKLLEDFIKDLQ